MFMSWFLTKVVHGVMANVMNLLAMDRTERLVMLMTNEHRTGLSRTYSSTA
ncbi:hypothetical protein GLYMA_18G018350v4 [Glycine max]|nr:hypothetical protein GLYMA_18G018350v4 [Glycine max]KAH1152766.1 hypothetical protein GYH30_048735 [Glycine max]